jgi:hypothetical protein
MNERWIPILALAAGCSWYSSDTHLQSATLAHASTAERQEILSAEQRVNVANLNVDGARAGVSEAHVFARVAKSELNAASSELSVVQKHGAMTTTTGDETHGESAAMRRLQAARAKKSYADSLTRLRQARLNSAEAEAKLARVEVQSLKISIIESHRGSAEKQQIQLDREQAAGRLANDRMSVRSLTQETDAAHATWLSRQRNLTTASSALGAAPPPPRAMP